jgi:hypothetical protein
MRIVLLVVLLAACSSDPAPAKRVAPAEAAALLTDRNWLDVWPTDKDDRLHVYRFVPSMGGGVYHDRTVFQGEFELFVFDVGATTIDFTFPHTDRHLRTDYKIERVTGPEPFDLKLTLGESPRGPRVYYGIAAQHGTIVELDAQLAAAIRE